MPLISSKSPGAQSLRHGMGSRASSLQHLKTEKSDNEYDTNRMGQDLRSVRGKLSTIDVYVMKLRNRVEYLAKEDRKFEHKID